MISRKIEEIRLQIVCGLFREETKHLLKVEALNRLFTECEDNPQEFDEAWVAPLLDAGLSLERAFAHFVEFHLQPN